MRYIISGGGTGGHVFPAIAIADALKKADAQAEILFVGANGRMEMERVPAAGYSIKGLDVVGFQRKLTLKNLVFPFKLVKSLMAAYSIVKSFKPDVAIGVGGYASGPTLKIASWLGIPTMLQEQNSYAGVTNKLLAKMASRVFVAYPKMERFFDEKKVIFSGNPVRAEVFQSKLSRNEAVEKIGLDPSKKTILIFGGSLGARTLNEAMIHHTSYIAEHNNVQWIWQAGKTNIDSCKNSDTAALPNVRLQAFIEDMATIYAASDIVVSRAGALTISELSILGKPSILVPSPNVAEDHQTHNAMSLVNESAAILVKDNEAKEKLVSTAIDLVNKESEMILLSKNLVKLGRKDAADNIALEIIGFLKAKK